MPYAPCVAIGAGGAAATWSASCSDRSAQVTPVLLCDAGGTVLRCLAPCLSLRKTPGGETHCGLPLRHGPVVFAV